METVIFPILFLRTVIHCWKCRLLRAHAAIVSGNSLGPNESTTPKVRATPNDWFM